MKMIGRRKGCLWLSLLLVVGSTLGACGLIKGIVNFDGTVELAPCEQGETENCSKPKQEE